MIAQLLILCVLAAGIGGRPSLSERGVPALPIENDINVMITRTQDLNTVLNGFPASGLSGALNIHTAAQLLDQAIGSAVADALPALGGSNPPGAGDEDASNVIVQEINTWSAGIQQALGQLTLKEPSFSALPFGGLEALITQDISALNLSTSQLGGELAVDIFPPLKPNITANFAETSAAFSAASAAFAT
ncbi:hypothetical protein C8F01DRAFT_1375195 [Mycena amicta]|nr:hypothetical protein C8F01DRAFT_1375195 [Mycena amicta]